MGKTKTAFIGEDIEEQKGKVKPSVEDAESMPTMASSKTEASSGSKPKKTHVRSKKYAEQRTKVDKTKLYPVSDAIKLVKETSYSKFDGSVELHVVVKKSGLSTQVTLPHSTGKSKKVEVADEKTVAKLEKGLVDFDVLLTTPDMMPKLVPFARILGPKGLMPNPKNGTIIKSVDEAKKFSVDKLTIKTEKKAPLIHVLAGKISMSEKDLEENVNAVLAAVNVKQVVRAYLCSTMGPSVKLQVN